MSRTTRKLEPQTVEASVMDGLPEGWAISSVGQILNVNYGKGLKEANRKPGKVSVYGSNGVVGKHVTPLTLGPTIIIGRKGTVGAVHFCSESCWPIDTTYYIDEFRGMYPKYVVFALRNLTLGTLDTSTTIPGLNRDDLYAQEIPLAPLAEQKRIVAKIEELLVQVDATRDRLARAAQILKRFRQAVLAAACSGRLTEDWREKHKDIESVETFLTRRGSAQGRKMVNCEPPEVDDLGELPESWTWASVGMLFRIDSGEAFKKKDYSDGGLRLFQIANVGFGRTLWEQKHFLPAQFAKTHRELLLKPGEIVIALNRPILGGSLKIARLSDEDMPAILYQRVGRFRPLSCDVSPYFYIYAQSKIMFREVEKRLQGTDQPYLNTSLVPQIPLPLPPTAEQNEIVRHVETLFAHADAIESQVEAATKRADKLTQAILAKAFRGELVPTEAELARREGRKYEPASELLKRICLERDLGSRCEQAGTQARSRISRAANKRVPKR